MQSLWMIVASLLFTLMGVCVKLASSSYTVSEIVMYRGLFGVFFLFFLAKTYRVSLKTSMPWRHFSRGFIGVISLWMWFYSIANLPLAMANTLNYMSPIWIATILFVTNWWHGKTHFSWKLTGAIMLSFIGVVLLLQPSILPEQLPTALIAFISAIVTALAYLQVRSMGLLGEPETRVVFYFSLSSVLAGIVSGLLVDQDWRSWHEHQPMDVLLLLLVGFFASTAQLAMTRAYRLGHPLLTANLSYSGIVFSSVLGMLIWNDQLGAIGWIGMAVIMASGMLATYLHVKISLAALAKEPIQ